MLAPSVSQFQPGANRFGFGLFDRSRAQIADAPAALYVAPVGGGKAIGPIVAGYESLAVKAQFQSRSVSSDPDAAKSLYVADVQVRQARAATRSSAWCASTAGWWRPATRAAPLDGRAHAAACRTSATRAPKVEHPDEGRRRRATSRASTPASRPRPCTRPTSPTWSARSPRSCSSPRPALCQSRVCGPVVDIAEQVKAERGDEAEFIHQEIFVRQRGRQGLPARRCSEWKLPTEPWLFAVDREGQVAARLEGAFSASELEPAVDAAVKGASS